MMRSVLLVAVLLASCGSPRQIAYESAVDRHGLSFTAPKDSGDVMWKRALGWFDRPDVGASVGVATGDAIESRKGSSGERYTVSRLALGDSIRYIVSYQTGTNRDNGRSGVLVPYTARKWAYWIHYGIDAETFPDPSENTR